MSQFALNDLEDISMLTKQFIDYSSQVMSVLGRNSIDYPDINGLDEVPSDKECFVGLECCYL